MTAVTTRGRVWMYSFLFWLVGLSSWITITGLFNELSLMIKDLTEGFEIWSYITLIIQFANIGPFIYSIIPRQYKTQKFVIICAYLIFTFSCCSMIIMSLFWDTQITIFGSKRSLILYLATFGTSICDCMTSIIFWVFVSYFPTQYMAFLSAGESSSGIICAILIYIQQLNRPEDEPRYSVEIYFFIIAMLLPISGVAFTLLIRALRNGSFHNATDWISPSRVAETSYDTNHDHIFSNTSDGFEDISHDKKSVSTVDPIHTKHHGVEMGSKLLSNPDHTSSLYTGNSKLNQYSSVKSTQSLITENPHKPYTEPLSPKSNAHSNQLNSNQLVTSSQSEASTGITQRINGIMLNNVGKGYWHWIVMIAALSAVQNGMLPAISSYSLLPYGDLAYIYSVTISNILSPICSIFPVLLPRLLLNKQCIFICTIGWVVTASYILMIALQSPHPFGIGTNNDHNQSIGIWRMVIIIVSVCCSQSLTLCKTCIYLLIKKSFMLKSHFMDDETLETGLSKMMEIVGIAVQVGSLCGAVIFFLLVNVADLFQQ